MPRVTAVAAMPVVLDCTDGTVRFHTAETHAPNKEFAFCSEALFDYVALRFNSV